jgi:hypothetical protein
VRPLFFTKGKYTTFAMQGLASRVYKSKHRVISKLPGFVPSLLLLKESRDTGHAGNSQLI